MFYYFIIINK